MRMFRSYLASYFNRSYQLLAITYSLQNLS